MSETANRTDCRMHPGNDHRRTCSDCNAAYMRGYLRARRRRDPIWALLERARSRAQARALEFSIERADLVLPAVCPALGIPIQISDTRSQNSPSLDRIEAVKGYVKGNVRVISDRANRHKSDRNLQELRALARRSTGAKKRDYELLCAYLERELLLKEVRARAERAGPVALEWGKVARFLEAQFRSGRVRVG